MKVAVLFEYPGTVRDAFIRAGHYAVSYDLLPSESDFGPHICGDIMYYPINTWESYDLIIAHPPCTYMAVSGNRWYAKTHKRAESAELIYNTWRLPCEKLCIENPVGQINTYIPQMPKPQYIQPWEYGHGETKKTGLWKRNLPDLKPTNIVEGREQKVWKMGPSEDRGKLRSIFFKGIADAMAEQWGKEAYLPLNWDKTPAYRPTMRPEWLR